MLRNDDALLGGKMAATEVQAGLHCIEVAAHRRSLPRRTAAGMEAHLRACAWADENFYMETNLD